MQVDAAGLALVMPDGTALFLKRSPESSEPGMWCLPGGTMEGSEPPLIAAIRETREETGFIAPDDAEEPRLVATSKNGYKTFKQRVTSQFIPTLDDENVAWAWAPLDDPPQPVHPGLEETLPKIAQDQQPALSTGANAGIPAGMMIRREAEDALQGADMTPEEWKGLVGGLLEFFAEEAMEPEHAEAEDAPRDDERMESPDTSAQERRILALYHRKVQQNEIKNTPENLRKFLREHGISADAAFKGTPTKLKDLVDQGRHEARYRETAAVINKPRIPTSFSQADLRQMEKEHAQFMKSQQPELRKRWGDTAAKDEGSKTLYASRPLKNGADVIAWARQSGFPKTLSPDDMHVTLAYSKTPVAYGTEGALAPRNDGMRVEGGTRSVEPLGDEGAIVLRFESPDLTSRWEEMRDAGASWQYPSFQPHVTFTMDSGDVDLSKIEPYDGPLDFGPERFKEIKAGEDWAAKARASMVGDDLTEKQTAEGKLTDRQESAIGTVGSEKRDEMPEGVFLEPASKKYPVKEKQDGEWKYNRKLLLAAARRARMNGNEALASRADSIRERVFGEGAQDAADDFSDVKVDAEHDGPWVSCMSKSGTTMYRNRNVPAQVEIDGKMVDVDEDLKHHEIPEWRDLENLLKVFKEQFDREPDEQERKVLYQGAHGRSGTPSEKAYCQSKGINWKALSAWFRGMEAKVEKGPFENEPDDADVKPIPHGHGELAATDSALKLALDKDSSRVFDKDGRMHVSDVNICKACVSPYLGREIPDPDGTLNLDPERIYKVYRPADEIEKGASTSNGIQILRTHVPVDADDHRPYDIIGCTGSDATFENPYLKNSLHFWTKQSIDDIESNTRRELSPGYRYLAILDNGTFDGDDYEIRMSNIEFNHIITTERGRQNDSDEADIIVGDSAENLQWGAIESALTTLGIDA